MKALGKLVLYVAAACFLALVYLYLSSPLRPEVWVPGPSPGLNGDYALNTKLSEAKRVLEGEGKGPEAVTLGPDGLYYTGYHDGRIVRFAKVGEAYTQAELFVDTGGRPLGMEFDASGNLIVADAYKGLLSITPELRVTVLTDHYAGEALKFTDDLDIAEDGRIWFSTASQRFGYEDVLPDILEASATGLLLSYTPSTGKTELGLGDLYFANGVALGPDDDYVLVNETGAAQIRRLWLKGEKAGRSDVFISGLAGMPDNITFNGRDTFWVALNTLRSAELDAMAPSPLIRRLVGALPPMMAPVPYGFVVGLDLEGNVKANYQDGSGHVYSVTSVREEAGELYIGSLEMQALAVLKLP